MTIVGDTDVDDTVGIVVGVFEVVDTVGIVVGVFETENAQCSPSVEASLSPPDPWHLAGVQS